MAPSSTQKAAPKLLTELELELMTIVWRLGNANVSEVQSGLPASRELATTTVSTVLRILEQKKVVRVIKEGRSHRYAPLVTKAEYEGRSLSHLMDQVFDGTPASLVRRLLESDGLSRKDLEEIRNLFEARVRK